MIALETFTRTSTLVNGKLQKQIFANPYKLKHYTIKSRDDTDTENSESDLAEAIRAFPSGRDQVQMALVVNFTICFMKE